MQILGNQPTIGEWKRAYRIAAKIKEMAPWEWMYDLDNFGFEYPGTGERGFVCVMGHEAEHFGITIYRGAGSIYKVLHATRDLGGDPMAVLEIDGVSLSFEDREYLKAEDRQLIKKLGLKFRGHDAWPLFRSNRPAHIPWFVDADELDFLLVGLERLLAVAPIWKDDEKCEELLEASNNDRYLMCIPSEQVGDIAWKEEMQHIDEPEAREIVTLVDENAVERAQELPSAATQYELTLTLMLNPIQGNPDERPYFCYLMIFVDAGSGFVAGSDLVPPYPTVEAAYGQFAQFLVEMLLQNKIIPDQIYVRNEFHAALLEPVVDRLGIKIIIQPTLPRCEDAITSLMNFRNQ